MKRMMDVIFVQVFHFILLEGVFVFIMIWFFGFVRSGVAR